MVKEAHWHDVELEQLCRSWLEISRDPTVGTNQKGKELWAKIEHHFNRIMTTFRENHPGVLKYVFRSHRAIDTQWGKISHDCSKFSGAVATIEAQNPSGTNWEQRIERSKVLYRISIDPEEKEFKFFSCWMILKDNPKWKVISDTNKKKKATKKRKEIAGQSSTLNDGGTQDAGEGEDSGDDPDILGTPERRTVIGTKKAKELVAAENRQQKEKEALAESTRKIAAAMNRRASILEEAHELQLVTMDTSSMTERQKQFFEKKMQLVEANLERKLKAANVESSWKEKENVTEGGAWKNLGKNTMLQILANIQPQQRCQVMDRTIVSRREHSVNQLFGPHNKNWNLVQTYIMITLSSCELTNAFFWSIGVE